MTKILLGIPDSLLLKLNVYCQANDYERSELIRHLIRQKLDFVDDRGYTKEQVGVPTSEEPKSAKNIKNKQKDPSVEEIMDKALTEANESGKRLIITTPRSFWVCEHGNRGRLCKHEKCRQIAIKKGDV